MNGQIPAQRIIITYYASFGNHNKENVAFRPFRLVQPLLPSATIHRTEQPMTNPPAYPLIPGTEQPENGPVCFAAGRRFAAFRPFWLVQPLLRKYEKKARAHAQASLAWALAFFLPGIRAYIIPIPAPAPAGIAGVSSLMSATTDSVVSSVEAMDVAF